MYVPGIYRCLVLWLSILQVCVLQVVYTGMEYGTFRVPRVRDLLVLVVVVIQQYYSSAKHASFGHRRSENLYFQVQDSSSHRKDQRTREV